MESLKCSLKPSDIQNCAKRNMNTFNTLRAKWKLSLIISFTIRSSHHTCFVRKGALKNFTKFPGKHLCQSLFFNKVAGLSPATLLKKRLWHKCFPVNFVKFLTTPFLQNTSKRLLLLRFISIVGVFYIVYRSLWLRRSKVSAG